MFSLTGCRVHCAMLRYGRTNFNRFYHDKMLISCPCFVHLLCFISLPLADYAFTLSWISRSCSSFRYEQPSSTVTGGNRGRRWVLYFGKMRLALCMSLVLDRNRADHTNVKYTSRKTNDLAQMKCTVFIIHISKRVSGRCSGDDVASKKLPEISECKLLSLGRSRRYCCTCVLPL